MELGEKEIELERMKITIMALNQKMASVRDLTADLDKHKEGLDESNSKRAELQGTLEENKVQIEKDTEAHTAKQAEMQDEIDRLKALLAQKEVEKE